MSSSIVSHTLDNGLQVILQERHTAPVISTYLWYRVGSRDEVEGHTGVSHWVEHMMFKGSPRYPKGTIMRSIDRNGGYSNAMTSYDFTAYYCTLPSDRADLALDIESDRMRGAFFDPDEVAAERTVVLSERKGSENEPGYVLSEEMGATAFRVHPYHHRTIGWKEDIEALTREQLYGHYQAYYAPNNAVLVVAGDFDTNAYLAKVESAFGHIAAQDLPVSMVRPEPESHGERRVTVRMPGSAPRVRVAYRTPSVSHPDYIPLVVLDAVLSGGKAMFAFGHAQARSARLYRALVQTELASSADSGYHPSLDPYLLTMSATVRDGHESGPLEDALHQQAALLGQEPVSADELRVAIRQTQAQFAYSSESVSSQALTLGFLEMVDHHQRIDTILDELAAVTSEDVMRVAQMYLVEDNRIVGNFEPTDQGDALGDDDNVAYLRRAREHVCYYDGAAISRTISPETVVRHELGNGAVALIRENWASPTVSVGLALEAGCTHEPADLPGLAALTGAMLRRGTARHSYDELNTLIESVGAETGLGAGRDEMEADGVALAEDFDLLVDTLSEIMMMPSFPQEELAKIKGQYLTHLTMMQSNTGYRAERAFAELLYGQNHPFGRPLNGTRESVAAIARDDLVAFYRRAYHPGRLMIAVVGAVESERILAKLNETFGRWQSEGDPLPWRVPDAPVLGNVKRREVDIPSKSQADIVLGVVGVKRSAPDYYAASMANMVLGRLGLMGRLGESVRDEQGLAYYVGSSLRSGLGAHPWSVSAGVQPDDLQRATAGILEQIARMRDEPISDQELDDCCSYLTGALPLRLETNDGIVAHLLNIEQYGLGLDYLSRYPSIIRGVTKEDMQSAVQRYWQPGQYALAWAGTFS